MLQHVLVHEPASMVSHFGKPLLLVGVLFLLRGAMWLTDTRPIRARKR